MGVGEYVHGFSLVLGVYMFGLRGLLLGPALVCGSKLLFELCGTFIQEAEGFATPEMPEDGLGGEGAQPVFDASHLEPDGRPKRQRSLPTEIRATMRRLSFWSTPLAEARPSVGSESARFSTSDRSSKVDAAASGYVRVRVAARAGAEVDPVRALTKSRSSQRGQQQPARLTYSHVWSLSHLEREAAARLVAVGALPEGAVAEALLGADGARIARVADVQRGELLDLVATTAATVNAAGSSDAAAAAAIAAAVITDGAAADVGDGDNDHGRDALSDLGGVLASGAGDGCFTSPEQCRSCSVNCSVRTLPTRSTDGKACEGTSAMRRRERRHDD